MYMKMPHRADIYQKTTTTSPAGQKKASWVKEQSSIRCFYSPKNPTAGDNRAAPTFEQWNAINMFFPSDVTVSANSRIYNICDRAGNLVDSGPLEITQITRQPGFSGKVHHYMVMVQKVIED
jgi:hypothetical protein